MIVLLVFWLFQKSTFPVDYLSQIDFTQMEQ